MAKNLMIDLETLAVSPNAVVLSLGAVHFDPYSTGYTDSLYFRIDIDDQDELGREVDPNTIPGGLLSHLKLWKKHLVQIIVFLL
jgi:hypothetical protein